MKRILTLIWMPALIASQEPITLQDIIKQKSVVEGLISQIQDLKKQRAELKNRITGQEDFIEALKQGKITLLATQEVTIVDLEAINAQDKRECATIEQQAAAAIDRLERETWYLTGLEMRHDKEKLAGIQTQLKEREQRQKEREQSSQKPTTTYPSSKPTAQLLQQLHRGGPEELTEEQQKLMAIIANLGEFEEASYTFAKQLTDQGTVPNDKQLEQLQELRDSAKKLTHEAGQLLKNTYPNPEQRAEVIATLHAQRPLPKLPQDTQQATPPTAVTQDHNPSAPATAKRDLIIAPEPQEAAPAA